MYVMFIYFYELMNFEILFFVLIFLLFVLKNCLFDFNLLYKFFEIFWLYMDGKILILIIFFVWKVYKCSCIYVFVGK